MENALQKKRYHEVMTELIEIELQPINFGANVLESGERGFSLRRINKNESVNELVPKCISTVKTRYYNFDTSFRFAEKSFEYD